MYPPKEIKLRLSKVRKQMKREGIDFFYVSSEPDLKYLTGHENGRILIGVDKAIFWVSEFYLKTYGKTYGGEGFPYEVRIFDRKDLKSFLKDIGKKRIFLSDHQLIKGINKLTGRKACFSETVGLARQVKTDYEIQALKKSASIAKKGMRKAQEIICEGVRELYAVAEIQAELYRCGSEEAAFGRGMLLASGKASADIHAKATLKKIAKGPVVVDLGAVYRGYHSDMTRTLALNSKDMELQKTIDFVKELRDELIDYILPGMLSSSVHKHMIEAMKDKGYEPHHLSGHGVGLEIHENPSFNPEKKVYLRPNMIFTVEPGVYIPGKYGVRFEDTVLLTKTGCKRIT
jgi:Xaa-Pro aminopeptidase